MVYSVLADLVVLVHLAFVVFVALGGLMAIRWPRVAWVHLPAMAWGVVVEIFRLTCPLTPLENRLRRAGGERGYAGDFIEHIARRVLYAEITPEVQIALGLVLLGANVVVYAFAIHRWRKRVETNELVCATRD
jgi:hypothetical protein